MYETPYNPIILSLKINYLVTGNTTRIRRPIIINLVNKNELKQIILRKIVWYIKKILTASMIIKEMTVTRIKQLINVPSLFL